MPARKVTENSADRLTIVLDAADKVALAQLARKSDRSLAWVVRDAVREYLAKHGGGDRKAG